MKKIIFKGLLIALTTQSLLASGSFEVNYKKFLNNFQEANSTADMAQHSNELRSFCEKSMATSISTYTAKASSSQQAQLKSDQEIWAKEYKKKVKNKVDEEYKSPGSISRVNVEIYKSMLLKARVEVINKLIKAL